jgi:hypothetical protein
MPRPTFITCSQRVDLVRPSIVDRRHAAWNGRRVSVVPKFDVLRV